MHSVSFLTLAFAAGLAACTAQQPQAGAVKTEVAGKSLLASSTPSAGATVASPENIELHFARPARLKEVTIVAADGTLTPMMITAVGEVQHYSLPVGGLDAGSYTVRWKASSGGGDYQGDFSFQVR